MKLIKILFILLFPLITIAEQSVFKVYALYSPSHEVFVNDWFLPSFKKINDPGLELVLEKVDQECPTGTFMQQGWRDAMTSKVDLIIYAIERNMGDVIIYSDVDIQYFQPFSTIIADLMQDNDMLIQRDNLANTACAGFFACRCSEKILALWQTIRNDMVKAKERDDQTPLNKYLRENAFNIKWDFLPTRFFGGGTFSSIIWYPGMPLRIPKDPVMHHANYTITIGNKIAQLSYVSKRVKNNEPKP